jgi:DNA topoisomerase-1
VVRSCQELPGQHLFEYHNGDGTIHQITSSDVNSYLRDISEYEITAKDFRTWAGTVKAAMGLKDAAGSGNKVLGQVIADVAKKLGNTVAVCRKCYIHPALLEDFEKGSLRLRLPARARGGLTAAEIAVRNYLRRLK